MIQKKKLILVNCWKRGFLLYQILIITYLVSVCGILSKAEPCLQKNESTSNYKNICLTSGCIHAASDILERLDPGIKPCDNFYKFACGNYLKTAIIPDYLTKLGNFQKSESEINMVLRDMLETKISPKEARHVKMVKNLYQSCMNEIVFYKNSNSTQYALNILKKLGGWPVLENSWKEENFTWQELIFKLNKEGLPHSVFFQIDVTRYPNNNTRNILHIDKQKSLKLLSSDYVKQYHKMMVEIAVIFGANKTEAETELKEAIELDQKINKISKSDAQREKLNETDFDIIMTVNELQGNYSGISWKNYFNNILPTNSKIDDDEEVLVGLPSYFQQLESTLEKVPKRVQANYILLKVVEDMFNYLGGLRKKYPSLYVRGKRPQYDECIIFVKKKMVRSASAIYVQKHYNEESRNKSFELFDSLYQEFEKILENANWLDNVTKEYALYKLDSMIAFIGYDNELFEDNNVDEFYTNLEITRGNFLQSILNLTIFNNNFSFSQLKGNVNRTHWSFDMPFDPLSIGAFYSLVQNGVYLPDTFIQAPFFNKDKPSYINFGTMGFVIGHEIIHGFDNTGINFDFEGNIYRWLEEESEEKLELKTKCFVNQYGNYVDSETGLKLNANRTLSENISDNGGVKLAYLAYQKWVEQNKPESKLPGLDYTPSQLFWISVAQTWCSKYTTDHLKNTLRNDVHSPEEFRIIGAFSNQPEFAKDFDCPEDSKMNPKTKCSLW